MNKPPKLAVLVLTRNSRNYLEKLINSLLTQRYEDLTIYIIDNNSSDGTIERLESYKVHPSATLRTSKVIKVIKNKINLGYAAGNNLGLKQVFREGADLCLVLNPDVVLEKDAIEQLVKFYLKIRAQRKKVGLIQPLILLEKKRDKINSAGNIIHYLGFGYCGSYLQPAKAAATGEIISVSGAAMLISREFFNVVGGFDEDFFMIGEDQDLSWRGRLLGYQHYLCTEAIAYHDYQFDRHQLKHYWEEKNRIMMLLKNYSLKTLVILSLMIIINELAIILCSIFAGWFFFKLKSYWFILSHIQSVVNKRRLIQSRRIIEDKVLLSKFSATINFPPINNVMIKFVTNPVYWFYYRLIIHLI